MEAELFQDLKSYLGNDYDLDMEFTYNVCVKRAISSFRNQRNYPLNYSDSIIENDMRRYYSCLLDLVLYWCNVNGVEFQKSHSESGTSRSWMTEEEIYTMHKVIPIGRIF